VTTGEPEPTLYDSLDDAESVDGDGPPPAERPPLTADDLRAWVRRLAPLTLAAGVYLGASGATGLLGPAANQEAGGALLPPGATPAGELDDVLTVDHVAALLKLGRNAVYEAVGRGEIPHRRIGKQIRFSRRGIMRWLASCEAAEDKEYR
jgi:excisionase family DNA binding protein